MDIRIYDYENLPFGSRVKVDTPNGMKKAIILVGNVAFPDGTILPFEKVKCMGIYI